MNSMPYGIASYEHPWNPLPPLDAAWWLAAAGLAVGASSSLWLWSIARRIARTSTYDRI
jgi:hypothetical protein